MNYKTWLIVFGIIALLLIGGAGFYAFSGYSGYSNSLAQWDNKVGTIESLERRVPYPNEGNSEALNEKVEEYENEVEELYESLNTFQRPLNTTLPSTEFVQEVSTKVKEFRDFAAQEGFEFEESMDFQLGFNNYASAIPTQDLVPVLDYSLEAIDHMLRRLVDAGAIQLVSFDRDLIPGEPGGPESHASPVVHKYPVRLRFVAPHDVFQDFVNSLANDKEFFYVVRVLKIRNDMLEGPPKLTAAEGDFDIPVLKNPDSGEVASFSALQEFGYGTLDNDEFLAAAKDAGFLPSAQDAQVLMGQENLNVFMVVDLLRFINPGENAPGEEEADEEEEDR